MTPDGTAPLLLYAYGSYGYAMPASFATGRLSLVDRGFVYAIAHIRGGADKGWHWYQDGKMLKKPNTFSDFIAAAEHLQSQGYAAPGKIVAHGGSAGGLLMGAIANMRPDLFGGIIAEVPFVDVINTMTDDSLPLTPPEWQEWGNPIMDADAFRVMLGYSPYENVRAQDYPAILALAGLTDPRVTYWEPAKWVAKLRRLNTGKNLHRVPHQHGGRPRRRSRTLRPAERSRAVVCVRDRSCGRAERPEAQRFSSRYFCSSSTEANFTMPCGSSAWIEPSMNSV